MNARLALPLLALAPGCTVFSAHTAGDPPRIESHGLVDAHVALGFPAEKELLGAEVLDGRSQGALLRLNLFQLVRLEVGAVGAAVGLGPLDVGVGTLFYDPEPPRPRRAPTREAGEDSAEASADEGLVERAEPAAPDVRPLRGKP